MNHETKGVSMKTTSLITCLFLCFFLVSCASAAEQIPPESPMASTATVETSQAAGQTEVPTTVAEVQAHQPLPAHCRFGITAPLDYDPQMIAVLGVGNLLDWQPVSDVELPDGVIYVGVLRVWEHGYADTLDNLPETLAANPGGFWIIGNEPDTTYEQQDNLIAETYALRFYELATRIRALDPEAKIGFGTVVQPTPIRLRYLDRAWETLIDFTGSEQAASALIDFWSIHAFILNEGPEEWGTGVPPGFESDYGDAVRYSEYPFSETHSVDLFSARIVAFREWMAEKGERDKALWVTEYGSLFPSNDPPDGTDLINVSQADTTQFMLGTFDFMNTATDSQTGMPADDNRLVQRWFWYSLNDYTYNFGGTIFDLNNGNAVTEVGQAFIDYLTALPVEACGDFPD
jgi:hypothetical protein